MKKRTKRAKTVLAWHFLRADRRLQFDPHTLVEPGVTLREERPLTMCHVGLHGSVRALDALQYAPGPVVCRTRHGGEILRGDGKLCSAERTALWMADATRVLHEFACWCAERALLRERAVGREPDPRSWEAIEAKRRWLDGKMTDEELAAARDAAWAAASAAANAAWDAARAASAAASAASDAARAAWDAAWAAARAAAWDAAGYAQNAKLTRMLMALRPQGTAR